MSTIRIEDAAYARFRAPDLAEMRGFREDFGLIIVERTPARLVARACSQSQTSRSAAASMTRART